MKKLLLIVIAVLLAAGFACGWIGNPTTVRQYETVSGWRLYIAPDWSASGPFPPSGFTHVDLLLSTATMGYHEPYSFVAQLVTREPQRDLDLMLLSKLDTGVTYFGRIRVWCGSTVWDQTSEFEWVFAEDAPVVPTEWVASVPWAVCNDLWQTSIALHNPTDQPVTATLAFYSATGQAVAPGGLLFIERYIPPYGISAFYIDDFFPPGAVFAGSILMSADAPLDYLYLTTDGTGYLTYCTKFE